MRRKLEQQWLTVRTPLAAAIDEAQPAAHMSCDWLRDPLGLGIQVFPVRTYEILRELNHGIANSKR